MPEFNNSFIMLVISFEVLRVMSFIAIIVAMLLSLPFIMFPIVLNIMSFAEITSLLFVMFFAFMVMLPFDENIVPVIM